MFHRYRSLSLAGALVSACFVVRGAAATYLVDSIAALQSQIDAAVSGDTITVKAGTYRTSAPIVVKCVGQAAAPITIAAESIGAVRIAGSNGFDVVKPAAYVVVRGFNFEHVAGRDTIRSGATHVRFTRNSFHCSGEGAEIDVAGDDAEIDHNEFHDKKVIGNMLSVTGSIPAEGQVARRVWVHHNFFHDYANAHENGAETIRFGRSFYSMSRGDGLIENNLFLRCTGENEIITNKSCANTYRYNTFLDSPGGELSQRHGNDCLIYGNYLRGTHGIRIFGDRHQVFSNYLEGNQIAIAIGNGDGEVADGSKLTCHDRPDHCVIAFNTLVNNRENFVMPDRARGLGATYTVFADNIIVGGGPAASIGKSAPYVSPSWVGNIVWKTDGPGDLPRAGYNPIDPQLVADARGVYRLRAGSPAIDAATGSFPLVAVDMDGQQRSGPKDIGADEFQSNEPIKAHLLAPADVGPQAP